MNSIAGFRPCAHHWVLGTPSGGLITGRCRDCGRERIYDADPPTTFSLRRGRVRRSAKPRTLESSGS